MKLTKISIKNILGVDNIEFDPKKLTWISGKNGSGKTSIIAAIRSIFEHGKDPSLRKVGSDKGEIVLEIQDGDVTHKVRRSITEKGDYTTVDPGAGKSWLQEIAEAARLNPVAFIQAKPAERLRLLLQSSNIDFPREKLLDVVSSLSGNSSDYETLRGRISHAVKTAGNAFDKIEAVREVIYEWRTGVNRSHKDNRSTAERLREALPSVDQTNQDLDALLASARAHLENLGRSRYEGEQAIRDRESAAIAAARNARDEAMAEVAKLYDAATIEARSNLQALEEQQRRSIETRRTRELYQEMNAKAERLEAESSVCSEALDRIALIKQGLLESLPVPGLQIVDGDIVKDGVPFDRLNTQQQIDLAITIAENLPGDLDLCLIDGFECFDPDHQEAFAKRAQSSKLQFIVASVSPGGLLVDSREEAA